MIRSEPPEPPAIFIGRATIQAPVSGTSSRFATFSNPGTFAPLATWWTMKSFEGPWSREAVSSQLEARRGVWPVDRLFVERMRQVHRLCGGQIEMRSGGSRPGRDEDGQSESGCGRQGRNESHRKTSDFSSHSSGGPEARASWSALTDSGLNFLAEAIILSKVSSKDAFAPR
jgi:hypothetical protein